MYSREKQSKGEELHLPPKQFSGKDGCDPEYPYTTLSVTTGPLNPQTGVSGPSERVSTTEG